MRRRRAERAPSHSIMEELKIENKNRFCYFLTAKINAIEFLTSLTNVRTYVPADTSRANSWPSSHTTQFLIFSLPWKFCNNF